jgi:hypothetical protein
MQIRPLSLSVTNLRRINYACKIQARPADLRSAWKYKIRLSQHTLQAKIYKIQNWIWAIGAGTRRHHQQLGVRDAQKQIEMNSLCMPLCKQHQPAHTYIPACTHQRQAKLNGAGRWKTPLAPILIGTYSNNALCISTIQFAGRWILCVADTGTLSARRHRFISHYFMFQNNIHQCKSSEWMTIRVFIFSAQEKRTLVKNYCF